MIDITIEKPTLGICLFNIGLYLFFFMTYRKKYLYSDYIGGNEGFFIVTLFYLLAIFYACNGDFFNYQYLISEYDFNNESSNYGEKVYVYIAKYVNRNYLFWRVIVWGAALFCTCRTLRKFNVNIWKGLILIFICFIFLFSYARATLGMSIYFYGISFLLNNSYHKYKDVIIGVFLILFSTFFHSSITILLPLTIFAFIPINKYIIVTLIMVIPFAAKFMQNFLQELMNSELLINDISISSKITTYSEKESSAINIKGIFRQTLQFGSIYFPLIIDLYYIFLAKEKELIHRSIKKLSKITIAIVYTAITFLLGGFDSDVFYYRTLNMAFIPISIITVYLFDNGFLKHSWMSHILIIGFIYHIFIMVVGLVNV